MVSLVGLAIVCADWVINIVQTNVVGRNGERMLYTLRVKIFSHLQRLGLDFYEHEMSGRIMTRMTTDVDALDTFLQTGLITMVNAVLTFAGVLIALLLINFRLGITLLTIIPVLVAATLVFRAKSSRAYTDAREKVSMVNADLQENVAGLRTAQAYRREGRNQEHFAALSDSYRRSRLRAQRYIALYFPFVQLLSTVAGALILFVAAGEVHSKALTAGGLIAYLLYIDLLFSPVQQLSQVFDGYNQAAVGLRRIKDLLRRTTSTPEAAHPQTAGRPRGQIEFRDVRFRYSGQSQDALSGVNLVVRPGETVALVGQTGAGKSTMVKLVARYYDVTSGSLLIDGTDIRELDLSGVPAAAGRGTAGALPVSRHGPGRDRLRPPGCHRRRSRGGGTRSGGDRDDRPAARRLPARGGRAGTQPGRRPASADRPGPRLPGGSGHPAARRGHRRARPGVGGGGEQRDGAADGQAHHPRGRAPADDRLAGRPHRRDGVGQDR